MKDYLIDVNKRLEFIKSAVQDSGTNGIIFANSGGKDCALVGILSKMACANTVSLCLPCGIKRSYDEDLRDAIDLTEKFDIENRVIDLAETHKTFVQLLSRSGNITDQAQSNIAPRLRMMTLYTIGLSEGLLVAGTSNRSELHLGYFTKWGDGAYDFNPIADLTATEVLEFLRYFGAPTQIIEKSPSAGLFEGQTDEADLGITYASLDRYLTMGQTTPADMEIIKRHHTTTAHKRKLPLMYPH